jgi:hypothetical protein
MKANMLVPIHGIAWDTGGGERQLYWSPAKIVDAAQVAMAFPTSCGFATACRWSSEGKRSLVDIWCRSAESAMMLST